MKLLSIGNSFSQDAQGWLHRIAVANGVELETTNLMIGGCSLYTHWQHVVNQDAAYTYTVYVRREDYHRAVEAIQSALR